MKSIIFAAFLVGLAGSAQAQQGWVRLNTGTTAGFSAVNPHGSDTVYASGGTLLRSTDGGTSWQNLPNTPSSTGILSFLDDTTGFLVAPSDTIYKTTNSMAWKPVGIGYMGTIIFHGRDTVWTFNQTYLSRSTDGGNSWEQLGVRSGPEDNAIAFAPDGKHGYIMGPATYWTWRTDFGDVGFTAADIARTTDAGTSWSDIYFDSLEAPQRSDTKGFTFIPWGVDAIAVTSESTIIAVGAGIAKSTDRGDNWDTILKSNVVLYAVCFPDSSHGTAVGGDGLILHTNDGGLSWTLQNSGLTTQALYSVQFTDSLNGYASGSQGAVIRTTNGGLSWVRISLLSNQIQGDSYPNPADKQTTLSYSLPDAQHVTISIQNVAGITVLRILDAALQSAGQHTIPIDVRNLSCGTYFVHIQTEKYFDIVKFQVLCN